MQDVKGFVLEILKDHTEGDIDYLEKIYLLIEMDEMLAKHQAKYLDGLLQNLIIERIQKISFGIDRGMGDNPILAVDELQIFSEAWSKYCRPGAYRVDRSDW